MVANDSAVGSGAKEPKYSYHKLDNDQSPDASNDIDEDYSGFDQNSKQNQAKRSPSKSGEDFFLDEDNISVDKQ